MIKNLERYKVEPELLADQPEWVKFVGQIIGDKQIPRLDKEKDKNA